MSEQVPLRVLLVDDEVGFAEVLAKRLRRRGLAVEVALSGAEGLRLLRENDFDAAVCDLKMVDMDGIEVLKVFKKMVPAMPVVMLTGHGSEEAAKDGLAAGAADYLLKPCDIDELLAKLVEAVGKAKADTPPPSA
ncbi:MAG: response regulator [Solidesulfovibrio sp. DCME]|uniref:response regulator n=1 Tax=Solidesulfovibrio sp. DCME TaxID=3447380 RepID=UPI003D118EE8